MRSREVINRIERLGGQFVRQVGSHRRYGVERDGQVLYTTVQVHVGAEIPIGTLRQIERDLAPLLGKGWLR